MENSFELRILTDDQLSKLRDFYQDVPYAPYVFSFLETAIEWKNKRPDKRYITIYVPDNWEVTGTFVAHLQWSCHDFFVFTKEESCETLYNVVKNANFEWKNRSTLFYAVHQKHFPTVHKALTDINADVNGHNAYDIWWMPKKEAETLVVECPPDVFIGRISKEHVEFINSIWPNRYDGSLKYLTTFVEMNGAIGLFLKSNGCLVSWIFKVHLGTMAILQTVEEHKGKGYGALVTKILAKEIALRGHDPLGTVLTTNTASQKMFTKIGFRILDQVYYIHTGS